MDKVGFQCFDPFSSVRVIKTDEELAGLPFRDSSQWLQEQPLERHVGLLDLFSSWRPQFASVIVALQTALSRSGASRMVYVTMVYGNFNKYIHGWARRLKRIGVKNLVMAALDAEAYQLCREHHGEELSDPFCLDRQYYSYTMLLYAMPLLVARYPQESEAACLRPPSQERRQSVIGPLGGIVR